MADIQKPDMSSVWASGGAILTPSTAKIETGWTAEIPPHQWENYVQNRQDNAIAYLFQKGIPEWDAATEYQANKSFVQYAGVIYKAKTLNTNKQPNTNPSDWGNAITDSISDATTTTKGVVELATNAETQAGTDTTRAVTPSGLASMVASESLAGLLEIATTAESQSLTNDTAALTPKKLADALGLRVGHTFTGNDWTPIGNGLILQWGSATIGASASATITFPITFPNSCFVVVESNAYTTSGVIGSVQITGVITTTSFPVLNKTAGGSVIYRWMALGI